MESYDVLYTRNNLSKLVARAEGGETIEITRRGKPVARLGPIPEEERPWTGRELVEWLEANPLPPSHHKTREEIDEIIREMREDDE
ncbi:type II toxin-antitoxin system Phd/YefM family antitoxin [Herbiconiux sp. A18JL235]|uniref:Antitoxin n=1 Tax=Herbiconiux sp. A18JL235 TaxID=3152363 RepID=A0AB39BJL2_9MICO